jgi:hypothetical protein
LLPIPSLGRDAVKTIAMVEESPNQTADGDRISFISKDRRSEKYRRKESVTISPSTELQEHRGTDSI